MTRLESLRDRLEIDIECIRYGHTEKILNGRYAVTKLFENYDLSTNQGNTFSGLTRKQVIDIIEKIEVTK